MKKSWILLIPFVFIFIQPISAGKSDDHICWFDTSGAFHYGSPVEYINRVLTGEIIDSEFLEIIRQVYPGDSKIFEEQLDDLVPVIHSADLPSAIYTADSKVMKTIRKRIVRSFKSRKTESDLGTLKIIGYGVNEKGPVTRLNLSTRDVVIAIPADPKIIYQIPSLENDPINNTQMIFENALNSGPLKKLGHESSLNELGQIEIEGLIPGPWLIWINQYDFMTYLYRVQIVPGETVQLNLDTHFALGLIQPTM